ncbi:hypothetical protein MAPG_10832 [Magnaporthiopsis poae ATCC 64411]|uniref:DUF974 domain-containing protein n=1 Tax=Magnaporthiopsis poae (strain ATCC 64411 / 73-15) TaxID=644358 RepID=A0A0C4EDM7_MAGP6|nr:hypothetical protein MAPG_10832 [Magnaporthiopsis poae ATCC 64411]
MSHQRYPSDAVKEPHSISLKVLRLSRPSLVPQFPVKSPLGTRVAGEASTPASLAYISSEEHDDTNPDPFILSPILNLPPSFGSAYVGETFSCTLCANHDAPTRLVAAKKQVRDVRIEAEMKTPASATVNKLDLGGGGVGVDLEAGGTLQKVGNHVLAVTVSYYEATDTSGRTRTFRKLYQFVCKPSLIVRTKASALVVPVPRDAEKEKEAARESRWVLEAQLENCGEDPIQLERAVLDLEPGLSYTDCNWEAAGSQKPVLHPSEVEQVCFVVHGPTPTPASLVDGKVIFGVLGVGWRGEMGNRGFLSTGKLGTRFSA